MTDVFVSLGDVYRLPIAFSTGVMEEVIMTAAQVETMQLAVGPASTFGLEELQDYPAINRDIREADYSVCLESAELKTAYHKKHGFTYGAYSSVEARKNAGMWNASSTVRRIATDSAFAQVILEMNRMRDEQVDDEVLDMHKEYASGRFLLGLENPSNVATMVQNIDLYDLPKDYYRNYDTYLGKQQALFGERWQTPTDIIAEARRYDLLGPGTTGQHTALLEQYQTPLEMPSAPVFGREREKIER